MNRRNLLKLFVAAPLIPVVPKKQPINYHVTSMYKIEGTPSIQHVRIYHRMLGRKEIHKLYKQA